MARKPTRAVMIVNTIRIHHERVTVRSSNLLGVSWVIWPHASNVYVFRLYQQTGMLLDTSVKMNMTRTKCSSYSISRVATEGLAPSIRCRQRILNPPRMPIPPRRRAPGMNRARGLYDMTRRWWSDSPEGKQNRQILTAHDSITIEITRPGCRP